MKQILVLGSTGAMGQYLVPELCKRGYRVDSVAKDLSVFTHENLQHFQVANVKDLAVLSDFLKNHYDGIIDFMLYTSDAEFRERYQMFLDSTDHYIFLSTYRVYAGEYPITEESPRLLDVSEDREMVEEAADYCIYKALQENILRQSSYRNWTILRPSIIYSGGRLQLVTLEAPNYVARVRSGKPIMLPKQALDVQATMTWAGDVAKMIAGLLFNPQAYGEAFSICTAEHHTWGEVAELYREFMGLEYVAVDKEVYLNFFENKIGARRQLEYDRLFNRVMDNSKILRVTGLKQEEFTPLRVALKREIDRLPADLSVYKWWPKDICERWDKMFEQL